MVDKLNEMIRRGIILIFSGAVVWIMAVVIIANYTQKAKASDDTSIIKSSQTEQSDSLGDLIVLNNLFDTKTSTNLRSQNLSKLLAVDRITSDNSDTSLSELIVLSDLFGSDCLNEFEDLSKLIAVDRLIDDKNDKDSLEDLIVLNSLFDQTSTNRQNLAKLIAVDRITD